MNFYKNNKKLIIVVLFLMFIAITAKQFGNKPEESIGDKVRVATTTEPYKAKSESNGIIAFTTPEDFGLASNNDQLPISSYIPPCDVDFDFCLYYKGTEYAVTNFQSAGVRIKNRTDLKTATSCLNDQPTGYTGLRSTTVASTTGYSMSMFSQIASGGAGHVASGDLYRLVYDGTCHEMETRISSSQFENFKPGSIQQFTETDLNNIKEKLKDIVFGITLENGQTLSF